MGLDIGGFIGGLREKNRIADLCRVCGRSRAYESKRKELPTTEIIQRCPECGSPLIWAKTNSVGKREVSEWNITDKRIVRKEENNRNGIRIEFD